MFSIPVILVALALVFVVIAIMGRLPLWVAVLCLILERVVTLFSR